MTLVAVLLASHSLTLAAQDRMLLASGTTIPVVFLHTIHGSKAHAGDTFRTRTTADVFLASGQVIPKGTVVMGHVAKAMSLSAARPGDGRKNGDSALLAIQFDSIVWRGRRVSLSAKVRAMADPIASFDARSPEDSDLDPDGDTTQIGGDHLSYVASEVRSRTGEVVGHRRRHGTYARLAANQRGTFVCDGFDSEQAVGLFSADACGVYGYEQYTIRQHSVRSGSSLIILSAHDSPKVWAGSHALLQVQRSAE